MEIQEIIRSLIEQARDKDSLDGGEGGVFAEDARALREAIALLGEQRARVMTLEEVQLYDNSITLEIRNAEEDEYNGLHTALHVAELDFNNPPCEVFGISGFEHTELLRDDTYGVDWRCWTSRPTDEEREAVKWE